MILSVLFDSSLTQWESRYISACFLWRADDTLDLFAQESRVRMQTALHRLQSLPEVIARELALEELLSC